MEAFKDLNPIGRKYLLQTLSQNHVISNINVRIDHYKHIFMKSNNNGYTIYNIGNKYNPRDLISFISDPGVWIYLPGKLYRS